MDTKTTAAGIVLDELEAALLEGAAPISEEGLEIQRRWHELKSRMAPYEAELKVIQELLTDEMRSKGVSKLTYKGAVVVEQISTTRTKVDLEGIIAKYPAVRTMFVKTVKGTRFDAKKVVL